MISLFFKFKFFNQNLLDSFHIKKGENPFLYLCSLNIFHIYLFILSLILHWIVKFAKLKIKIIFVSFILLLIINNLLIFFNWVFIWLVEFILIILYTWYLIPFIDSIISLFDNIISSNLCLFIWIFVCF